MVDRFGRQITYMRLAITELCNLRCRYCMPEDGVCKKRHDEMLTEEEMIQAVRVGVELGVTKLRITGGEPLIKKNLLSICERAVRVPGIQEVNITTNGTMLPKLAKPLKGVGIKRINISLDTLDYDKYAYITRIGSFNQALLGLEAALEAGFEKIKINTVLIGGFNDDEIPAMAELTRRYPVDVRFIELMPMYDSGDFDKDAFVPCTTVLERLPELVPEEQDGGVARLYRLPGAKGNIGLISPVSANFCGECNRIRLTADGKLKPCLHYGVEYPIKGLSYEGVVEQFKNAIMGKPSRHGELSSESRSQAGRNMNQIGG